MRNSFIFLFSVCCYSIVAQTRLTSSERTRVWNLLKLHNFYLRWEQPSHQSIGVIVQATDNSTGEVVFSLDNPESGKLSLLLPLSNGNRLAFTTDLPVDHYPVNMYLVIADDILIATTRCVALLHEPLNNVDFRRSTPDFVMGSSKYFSDVTNDNVGSGNPLLRQCSLYKNIPPTPQKEELEKRTTQNKEDNMTCFYNNKTYSSTEQLPVANGCAKCTCGKNGKIDCHQTACELKGCTHPIYKEGNCCPTRCAHQCEFNSRKHDHGSSFWPESCVHCTCNDGMVECEYKMKEKCPKLACPVSYQKMTESECCPKCVHFDFCSLNPCPSSATCENTPTAPKCRCKEGFYGNGTFCYDIDECAFDDHVKEQLGGCGQGTLCVNTPGSFHCDCLLGHPRLNERTCLNLIRI